MQVTPFALFADFMGIAALLVLPVATYVAGRWTGQRWLFALGLFMAVGQVVYEFIARHVLEGAVNGGWGRGYLSMGEFITALSYIQRFVYAVVVGVVVLIVARAGRVSRN